ncbi:MAG TPA: ABC transporter substrate-binding protein [Beijerinckiaceae bacterium]|jgi:polar amino acid transport system substrate-binding protein|nr:ABC transporter substrate-binding protein [Beijerinckiaceae bacterium]
MKKASICIAALASLAVTSALAQALPDRIKEAKAIVVANVPNYPPMEFKDPRTATLTGLDIDLGQALAKKLGVEFKFTEISFEQMVSSLTTGRADMILSGMTDTEARRDTLDFVDYLTTGAQFYTTADAKDTFKTPADLCGKTVGASRRTSFPGEMEKWSKANCEAAGKPALKIVGTEGSADARTQLKQKRLDAAVQGSETLPYLMSVEPNAYAIVGDPFTRQHQGMGFAKKDTALRDAVAAALKAMIADGSYKAVLAKWNLEANAVSEVMINEVPVK